MKICPHCAQEIQAAAVVCKHCRRKLAANTTPAARRPGLRWPWILAVLICGYYLVQWSRSDYLEFDAHRKDWHRRCDAYVGAPVALGRATQAAACKAELEEMLAYASRKGWQQ
jgi:hypothetical protein